MPPADVPLELLSRCGDPARFTRLVAAILDRASRALSGGIAAFGDLLFRELERVPDPDRALTQLDRFLAAAFSPAGLLEDIARTPLLLRIHFHLVCSSLFLADVLVRDPEMFRWLTTSGVLGEVKDAAYFRTAAREAIDRFRAPDRRLNAVKRYQRRELLRIAARDLLEDTPLETTVEELSHLADAIVSVLLSEAQAAVEERYGTAIDTPVVILGLGKLGGGELNYSSDIDLMAVYGENIPLSPSLSTHDLVVRVVEQLIRLLTEATSEGFLYRTDFRLRPDGAAGALALSLPATLAYYESRGAEWERQMLVKARVVSGHEAFGQHALEQLARISYRRVSGNAVPALLRDVRSRLAARWDSERDIKHGRGGIRSVEFCVQALQLVHGPRDVALRTSSTLVALEQLAARGHVSPADADTLRDAYRCFRRVEHLLQLERFEQTHTLPEDSQARDELAWKFGCSSWTECERRLDERRRAVQRIVDEILLPGEDGAGEADPLSEESIGALGFAMPGPAREAALRIVRGQTQRPHDTSLRERLSAAMPGILAEAAREALPDDCLAAVDYLFRWSKSPAALAAYFEARGPRVLLLRLASLAPGYARALAAEPLALDAVFGGQARSLDPGLPRPLRKLIAETDALARYFLGIDTLETLFSTIAETADGLVRETWGTIATNAGDVPFMVAALGKYGGSELTPGSDLDVVFVYEPRGGFTTERAHELAAEFIARLGGLRGEAPLYQVDARLRPEGRSSPLATSREAYEEYLMRRASLWEIQSLLKARVVCGDEALAARVEAMFLDAVRARRITRADLSEIAAMRRRMEPENRFRAPEFFDVKKSDGGLVDAEFAVQATQLVLGRDGACSSIRNTFEGLRTCSREDARARADFETMAEVYAAWRRIALLLRTVMDTPSTLLPGDQAKQERLARAFGHASWQECHAELQSRRAAMRAAFTDVFEWLNERCR